VLVAAYLIETGLLLMVSPWTSWWHRNYFADTIPTIRWFMLSRWAWAFVAAAGALTAIAGLADLYRAFSRRPQAARSAGASASDA
jgi:hypothetical protein